MFTGNFKQCTPVDSKDHTMQDALEDYIYIKMYNLLKENIDNRYRKIKVVGYYNREISISIDQKQDKPFNYKRPTLFTEDDTIYL